MLEESFRISRIENEMTSEVSDRTIRDTLNTIVDHGWLVKNSPQAHEWHPGPKALDIDYLEESCNQSSPHPDDSHVYSGVDTVAKRYSDRVSNSVNLVVEKVNGGHALASHGPLEEYVKIPYGDGDPIQVALPRTHQNPRVLVCRERSITRGDDGVHLIKQPKLQIDDIVPVDIPLLFPTSDTQKEFVPGESDRVPLPLFANADTLRLSDFLKVKSGWRYVVRIDSISDRVASGTVYDRTKWRESSDTHSPSHDTLDNIAENIGGYERVRSLYRFWCWYW